MKTSAILRLAAQRIFGRRRNHGMCDAAYMISTKVFPRRDDAMGALDKAESFINLLQPDGGGFGYWGDKWGKDKRECRVLGLLLAAAIAESEGNEQEHVRPGQ